MSAQNLSHQRRWLLELSPDPAEAKQIIQQFEVLAGERARAEQQPIATGKDQTPEEHPGTPAPPSGASVVGERSYDGIVHDVEKPLDNLDHGYMDSI